MPDSRLELHLGRLIGILRWKQNIDLVYASFVARITLNFIATTYRSVDVALPVIETVLHETDFDATGFRLN